MIKRWDRLSRFRRPPMSWREDRLWGPPPVTIGIAARTADNSCIVTVSDRRISFEDAVPSIDSAIHKDWFVGRHWGALFATNETSFALPVIQRANSLLVSRGLRDSYADIREAMCDGYAALRNEYITRQFLKPLGIASVDQFRKEGPSTLGRKLFWSLARKIQNEPFGDTTFLVYGYDESAKNASHLFEVKNPGTAFDLTQMQYFAVGSGAAIAMASLNLRPVAHLSGAQLIYRALEAKFAAESSSAVGRSTSVIIANRGEPTAFLSFATIERIRALWESERLRPPPDEINKLISDIDLKSGVVRL
jgi:hypothetical protein